LHKKEVVFVFGTRPELIKLAPLIKETKKFFKAKIVSTGQHQELMAPLYEWFDLKVDFDLLTLEKSKKEKGSASISSVISRTLDQLESIFGFLVEKSGNPELNLVIVQGDTASAFAGALAGFLKKIPVIHLEAGLRTNKKYNPFPEEVFRAQISRIASFHFAPTKLSQRNLEQENIHENTFVVGNTVIDSLKYTLSKLKTAKEKIDLDLLEVIREIKNKKKKLFLVTMHRRENFGQKHLGIAKALNEITKFYPEVSILFPIHLNPEVRRVLIPVLEKNELIKLIEPLNYLSFVYLMSKSDFILTDSGGIQEEASFLGKPLFVLRESTERPEILEGENSVLVGTNPTQIFSQISEVLDSRERYQKMCTNSLIFGQGDSAQKIVKILNQII